MDVANYDRVVNWDNRLKNEWPFYRDLFGNGVGSILDCACGTGRHALFFAGKGFSVTGTDIDPAMIERSKENAAREKAGVEFRAVAFSGLTAVFPSPAFDAVICVGNSLSQVAGMGDVNDAVRNMGAVCRAGGLIVLHILNYRSLLKKAMVPRPLRVVGDDFICQKIFLPREGAVDMVFVTIRREGEAWRSEVSRGRLLPIMPGALIEAVRDAGFSVRAVNGDYAGAAFDEESSWDMIVTGIKAES